MQKFQVHLFSNTVRSIDVVMKWVAWSAASAFPEGMRHSQQCLDTPRGCCSPQSIASTWSTVRGCHRHVRPPGGRAMPGCPPSWKTSGVQRLSAQRGMPKEMKSRAMKSKTEYHLLAGEWHFLTSWDAVAISRGSWDQHRCSIAVCSFTTHPAMAELRKQPSNLDLIIRLCPLNGMSARSAHSAFRAGELRLQQAEKTYLFIYLFIKA